MNPISPHGYVGGNEKNRSLSQVSVEDTNKKKKLVDFAVVPGLKRIGLKMVMVSIIGSHVFLLN
jgi:hypothetical protein